MGQKVNPHGLRVGVIKDWDSRWFANDSTFGDTLVSDYKIRKYLKEKLKAAGVPKIEIERTTASVKVVIHCAKPGVVIGRGGAEIEKLRVSLEKMTGKSVSVNVAEVKTPDMNAQLVAESIAEQLEKRVAFRRAMKQAIGRTMRMGAKGIKITLSGRLGGAEIARSEHYHEGTIPLQTIRADIEYGFWEANTTYGKIGVKFGSTRAKFFPAEQTQTFRPKLPLKDATEETTDAVIAVAIETLTVTADPTLQDNREKEAEEMLLPKRVKYRRVQRGRLKGKATRGNTISYGTYGLVATEPAWITSNQIEAARIAMTRYIKRGGKVWIKIFPDKPITEKPAETRMGSGKGSPEYWVAVVKPGRVMFEMDGVAEDVAKEAMRLASHKLPIKCKFMKKEEAEEA